jgi:hypothetical protein
MAGRVSAAVVLGEQLDVLVQLASVHLVLDAVVREVHLAVEVRQVVLPRPLADLVLVAVGASVTVRPAAVVFLQELLVFALQVVVEDDALDLEAAVLVAEPGFLLAVGGVEVRVVVEFALAADARVEVLRRLVSAVQ